MVKNVQFLRDSMDTTYKISNLIKKSRKRDVMLQKIRKDKSLEYPRIRVLCPTRWTVTAESMKSILDNWVALQQVWDESLDGNLEPEIKSRIIGVKSQMATFDYFYRVAIIQLVFKTQWQFIQNTSKVFSYFLIGKRNCWFDTADNKFTPIRKWIWITLAENGTTSRGIRNNSTISFT